MLDNNINTLKLFILLSTIFLVSCSHNGVGNSNSTLPAVQISNATVNRADTATTCRFYVDLSETAEQQVSVDYATKSGTANSGKDFTSQSGTLTFQTGDQKLHFDVPILPIAVDSLRQASQDFYVQLSNPQNCTINVHQATGTIINDSTYSPTDTSGFDSPTSYPGYKLVWRDEFNDSNLDTNVWNYRTGTGYGGWGNNELEYYTSRPENVYLSGGNLVIEARKESYGGRQYTSGRINTRGKFDFTYGRVDIRAKLPLGQGIWPAFWMLGYDPNNLHYWPEQGEIDIMELLGNQPNKIYGTLHWKRADGSTANNQGAYKLSSGDFSQKYHVFSLLWTPNSMQFLVDDVVYRTISISSITDLYNGYYPFDNPFFLIFNVAVGGNWPGSPDSTTQFPQKMFVDYVRVFQKN